MSVAIIYSQNVSCNCQLVNKKIQNLRNICPNLILISENSAISVLKDANWLCREDNYKYSAHEHSAVSDGTKIAQTIEMEHQVFFYEKVSAQHMVWADMRN